MREFRLRAQERSEQILTLAYALPRGLADAGIAGTVEPVKLCPEVRVAVGPAVAPDRVHAALTRPFGQLEVRPVVEMVGTEDCAAMRGDGRLCIADPGAPPGEARSLLADPGFAVGTTALELGTDAYTGMPQLAIRRGPTDAERLCALTGTASAGRSPSSPAAP